MYAYSQQIAKPSKLEVFWSKLIKEPKQIVKLAKIITALWILTLVKFNKMYENTQ